MPLGFGQNAPDHLLARLRGESAEALCDSGSERARTAPRLRERSRLAVLLGGLLALLVGGALLWSTFSPLAGVSRIQPPERAALAERASPGPRTSGAHASSALPSASSSTGQVVVDVGGHVKNPGVYSLPPGSRIADALARAGGALPEADLSGINRAAPLADATKILVPRLGGNDGARPGALPPVSTGAGTHPGAGAVAATGAAPASGLIDLNTADEAALQRLPKIGPVLAKRIVEDRSANGLYRSLEELSRVKGCGPSVIEAIRPHATVSPAQ